MRLNRNYFLLYHGVHLEKKDPILIDEKMGNETFFELSALLLGVNAKNFLKIQTLKSFKELLSAFTSKEITTIEAMYHLQYSIIEHFVASRSMLNVQHLHLSFSYLLEENILKKQEYDKLISLFDPSLFEKDRVELIVTTSENFHTNKQAFIVSLNELREITKEVKSLKKIEEYLNSQHFSIGITGVMNAGKSTMLNALMGKEILGTSVVPETANLTIVKYAERPSVNVVYWNELQWKNIEKSALTLDAMAAFVKETQKNYADNLDEYIKPIALKEEITLEELHNFTSAASPDKRSNLVSHVELGSNLHFLQDGIEIVDTPGLDDVVVQREEITKEYIAQCDLMIHLMNVSQSATQKDIEFIIDAVLYQNVTKLLVVITRADMVSQKELDEVIEYTKRSIASQLHEQNSGSKLDFILQNLHFIALSGEMALWHKTGRAKEAEEKGYSLEKSGITKIETYLDETLFGKTSQRSALIIHSAKKQLFSFTQRHLEKLYFELELLSKNEDELEVYLSEMATEKKKATENFKEFSLQIKAYEEEARVYLDSLKSFLENELKSLQEVIKKRLLDETKYSLEKEKQTAQKRRIILIIDTAIKHGLVDILRDYRYKFSKKTEQISSALEHQYSDMDVSLKSLETTAFDSGFLTQGYDSLHLSVEEVLKSAKLKNLKTIESNLVTAIKAEFEPISSTVKKKAEDISKTLLEEFFSYLREPMSLALAKLEESEKLVQEHIVFSKTDSEAKDEKQKRLLEEIKLVEDVLKRCSL